MPSADSDIESIYERNAEAITSGGGGLKKYSSPPSGLPHASTSRAATDQARMVEFLSTDSEMDSFFKENESIVQQASGSKKMVSHSDQMFSSSGGSQTKSNENSMNEDLDDSEFDQIVSEAQR